MKRDQPGVVVCEKDHAALRRIVDHAAGPRDSDAVEGLASELDRASVVAGPELPPDVVCLGATVEFEDELTQRRQVVQLVLPAQAKPSSGRISVLAPVGTALLGLRPGQSLDWPVPRGSIRVRIVRVTQPAEAAPPLLRCAAGQGRDP